MRCANPVPRPILDSLWLPPEDPVSDSFRVHFGGGFGTHFGAHLERLKHPGKYPEGIWNLRISVSILQSFRSTLLRLRKLDGSLRTQLELPRQPSEGCLLFWFFLELWNLVRLGTGSGPGGGGQTSLKLMDGRSLAPVPHSCPHVTFGLTLAPSWRTGLGPISGPFWRRFWDSFWSSFGAPKLSRRGTRRHTEA